MNTTRWMCARIHDVQIPHFLSVHMYVPQSLSVFIHKPCSLSVCMLNMCMNT